jgi:formylglycine-generating enzyme required for sulfatase activity
LASFPADSLRTLGSWPDTLMQNVEDKLLKGDGSDGLAEAQRVAEQLPEIEKLFLLRDAVLKAAEKGQPSTQVAELKPRYEAAGGRLHVADQSLVQDRMVDAGRFYKDSASEYRVLTVDLKTLIESLLASANSELEAKRYESAAESSQAILKIRPDDATALGLARRANIEGGIAKVREHSRSGETEEALTRLVELRKRAPDDEGVRGLVNEHLKQLQAAGESALAKDRFDDAAREFERMRKLPPGDKLATASMKQVEIGRKMADVKALNQSGKSDAALAALDELQKLALTDTRVRKLRDSIYDPRRTITNSMGMKLSLIPSGEFMMGSPDDDEYAIEYEKPRHLVRITRPFYLAATEVTQSQYKKIMGSNPSSFAASSIGKFKERVADENTSLHPVEEVSWNDAVEFCQRLSNLPEERAEGNVYRLPTEAEWEYACRAGSRTRYHFGDDEAGLAKYAWYESSTPEFGKVSTGTTHPVGWKPSNAFGLHDMHGNVSEWCSDTFGKKYYTGLPSPLDDPQGPKDPTTFPVARGGSWAQHAADQRSAYRGFGNWPTSTSSWDGFRVARVYSGK